MVVHEKADLGAELLGFSGVAGIPKVGLEWAERRVLEEDDGGAAVALPKGGLEPSEHALTAAQREVFEGTGLSDLRLVLDEPPHVEARYGLRKGVWNESHSSSSKRHRPRACQQTHGIVWHGSHWMHCHRCSDWERLTCSHAFPTGS